MFSKHGERRFISQESHGRMGKQNMHSIQKEDHRESVFAVLQRIRVWLLWFYIFDVFFIFCVLSIVSKPIFCYWYVWSVEPHLQCFPFIRRKKHWSPREYIFRSRKVAVFTRELRSNMVLFLQPFCKDKHFCAWTVGFLFVFLNNHFNILDVGATLVIQQTGWVRFPLEITVISIMSWPMRLVMLSVFGMNMVDQTVTIVSRCFGIMCYLVSHAFVHRMRYTVTLSTVKLSESRKRWLF